MWPQREAPTVFTSNVHWGNLKSVAVLKWAGLPDLECRWGAEGLLRVPESWVPLPAAQDEQTGTTKTQWPAKGSARTKNISIKIKSKSFHPQNICFQTSHVTRRPAFNVHTLCFMHFWILNSHSLLFLFLNLFSKKGEQIACMAFLGEVWTKGYSPRDRRVIMEMLISTSALGSNEFPRVV